MSDPTMPNEAVETPTETVDAPEADTPEVETPESEGAEAETPEVEQEGAESEGDAEPEEFEFKFGAETIKLPKGAVSDEVREKLQDFVNKAEASTTRKHQELSEFKKSLEARAQTVEKLTKLNESVQEKFSEGLAIKRELDDWSKVDMNRLWQSNPDEARRVSDHISSQKQRLQSIIGEVNAAEQHMTAAQQQELQRQDQEGRAILERRIKGFSQKAPEVIKYVVDTYGIDPGEAQNYGVNVAAAEMAYKAMMYDNMQKAAKHKPKAQTTAPVTAKATGGTAKAVKDITKMSMDEYAAYMNRRDREAQAKRTR